MTENYCSPSTMLEYTKIILQKVSFDLRLFEKELDKAIKKLLQPAQVNELLEWARSNFYHYVHLRGYLDKVVC